MGAIEQGPGNKLSTSGPKIAQTCPVQENPAVDATENPADRKKGVASSTCGGWGVTSESLELILSQLDCAESLSNFIRTNKAHYQFVSEHAEEIWSQVVFNTCGHDIVKGTLQSIQERAKATVAPYYGKKQRIRTKHPMVSDAFEIVKNKNDRLFLRINEKLFQLCGEPNHTKSGDLVSLETPIIEDIGLTAVKAWAKIHQDSCLTLKHIPFQQGQLTLKIHNNLYAVCILSRMHEKEMRGKRNSFFATRPQKTHTLVFFKCDGTSITVLHAMGTAAFMHGDHGQVGINTPTALVAVGPAVLCVRVSSSVVHCFGPENKHGDQNWREAFNPVDFRRVLRRELPNFNFLKLIENLDAYDSVTGMTVIRCILESRNRDLCKTILEAISNPLPLLTNEADHLSRISWKLSKFGVARDWMLYSAVQTGDTATVQFLLDNGCTVRSTAFCGTSCVLTLCMDKPEIAEVIYDSANKRELDKACFMFFDLSMRCKPLCEPVLHILKRNNAALFDSGNQWHQLTCVIAMCAREQDPGRLVMNIRFIRTLIFLGSPLLQDDWDYLKSFGCPRTMTYLYTMDALKTIWNELNAGRLEGSCDSSDQTELQWWPIHSSEQDTDELKFESTDEEAWESSDEEASAST